ncbi:MAG: hypothetical protein WCQ47_07340, partial [bacterium]
MKIHYKLFITFGFITALAMVSVFVYLDHSLNKNYLLQLKDDIKKQSQSTVYILSKLEDKASLDDFIQNLDAKLGLRVTLINQNGVVISDSEVKHEMVLKLENHIGRPEVQDAIKQG